jgi:hypothetical protein
MQQFMLHCNMDVEAGNSRRRGGAHATTTLEASRSRLGRGLAADGCEDPRLGSSGAGLGCPKPAGGLLRFYRPMLAGASRSPRSA